MASQALKLETCNPSPVCPCGAICTLCEGRGFTTVLCVVSGGHEVPGVRLPCVCSPDAPIVVGLESVMVGDAWACRWCLANLD
jgi:hypothetical protein